MVYALNMNVIRVFCLDPTLKTTQSHQLLSASEQRLWSDLIHCTVPHKMAEL